MDVTTPEQAKIAKRQGLRCNGFGRVPADIRAAGGVARMADPTIITRIMVSVPFLFMAKARIGHFIESRILEALGVDYIDESEVLTRRIKFPHRLKTPSTAICLWPAIWGSAQAHWRGRRDQD
jgi:pyridoxal biosynthesis lyase PdxS